MSETPALLQTKGIRDGLLITLGEATWPELVDALVKQIEGQPGFYQGARVALDVGAIDLRVVELSALRDRFSEYGINLWAVLSESSQTERTAQNLGMATRLAKPRPVEPVKSEDVIPADAVKFVRGPLRSGIKVTHDGSILILGDVNPGAEIIAGGSVLVWGRLRGVVHAGANGDQKVLVCALELNPTQLRIASHIAVSPKKPGKMQPEVAYIQDDQLVAKPWQNDRMES